MTELHLRHDVTAADRDVVRAIVRSSSFFNDSEVAVAVELVDDYLARGDASGYRFLFAETTPFRRKGAGPKGRGPGKSLYSSRSSRRTISTGDNENAGRVVGYTCYGPIAGTESSWDLYWIAVLAEQSGRGVGSRLLEATVEAIREAGGTRLYAETSSREQYDPTRRFYETNGFSQTALLEDFYSPRDGKVIYLRRIVVR